MLTTVGALVLSVWLIVWSQGTHSTTFALIMGIIAAICFVLDLIGVRFPQRG